jgi:sulfur-oxidizing protein SoxA
MALQPLWHLWCLVLLALLSLATCAHGTEPISGYQFQSADTQKLQDDPFMNPGMLWVDAGKRLFNTKAGAADKACSDCHQTFEGTFNDLPKLNPRTGSLVNLTTQIQLCRVDQQQAPAISYESEAALALTSFITYQSHGQPVQPVTDPDLAAYLESGNTYFSRRKGQLDLACDDCHERSVGKRLRGDIISEGHGNGYPIYRLEWQSAGSLHRRLRSCDIGVRAEPYALGSQAYIEVELFLRHRAAGLAIETPAVRR